VDQIFDRFERLFKSWVAGEAETLGDGPSRGARTSRGYSSDPDLDAAMDELDDFLDRGRTETEARERREAADRSRREREEAARGTSSRGSYSSARTGYSGPPQEIVQAYRTLGLAYGTPFPQVKTQYKKLLMQNHPDRNSATPEQLKRSTDISAQINNAYQRIETWTTTGTVSE
jgi:DnaJ-domain-containing protein 1